MEVIWKPIPGHAGYEISNYGQIRSYWSNGGKLVKDYRYVSHIITERGYRRVAIRKDKKPRIWFVHRLVLLAFVGPNNGLQTNHKNGVKSDNRVENLEYVTQSENNKHAFKLKLKSHFGENHPNRTLTKDAAWKIKYFEEGLQKDIAKKYGISKSQVSNIKGNKSWSGL